jgi:hypothetical protein
MNIVFSALRRRSMWRISKGCAKQLVTEDVTTRIDILGLFLHSIDKESGQAKKLYQANKRNTSKYYLYQESTMKLLLFCDNNERRCGVDDRLSVEADRPKSSIKPTKEILRSTTFIKNRLNGQLLPSAAG